MKNPETFTLVEADASPEAGAPWRSWTCKFLRTASPIGHCRWRRSSAKPRFRRCTNPDRVTKPYTRRGDGGWNHHRHGVRQTRQTSRFTLSARVARSSPPEGIRDRCRPALGARTARPSTFRMYWRETAHREQYTLALLVVHLQRQSMRANCRTLSELSVLVVRPAEPQSSLRWAYGRRRV